MLFVKPWNVVNCGGSDCDVSGMRLRKHGTNGQRVQAVEEEELQRRA